MIHNLILCNFQPWEYLDLELGDITVIVGATDQGKSSIIRALSAVINNDREGIAFVHHGAKSAMVLLRLEGSCEITLEKGKGINRYTLDGNVYDKVGREVPEDIRKALEIWPLEFDKSTSEVLQFQHQLDPPFLLTDRGVRATRLLGAVSQVAVLYKAAGMALSEIRETRTEIRTLSGLVVEQAEKVANLEALDRLESLAQSLESKEVELTGVRKKYDAAEQLFIFREACVLRLPFVLQGTQHLKTKESFLLQLEAIETVIEAIKLDIQLKKLDAILAELKKLESLFEQLELIDELISVISRTEVEQSNLEAEIKKAEGFIGSLCETCGQIIIEVAGI